MAAKSGRKTISVKSPSTLRFRDKRSFAFYSSGRKTISVKSPSTLRFRDKRDFAFYSEIQDGCQKWGETIL